ncbi:GntR family transcriptional regulator [Subtercola frigoramans]
MTTDLRRDIVSGRFQQGERLTEARLSELYGVSRIPVREALRAMESEGFVIVKSYTERIVATITFEDRQVIHEMRVAVESRAAERAAENLDAAGRQKLVETLSLGMAAVARGDYDTVSHINSLLHGAIAEASGSPMLASFFSQLGAMVTWTDSDVPKRRAITSWMEHADIVGSIIASDGAAARQKMVAHLGEVAKHVRQSTMTDDAERAVHADRPDATRLG